MAWFGVVEWIVKKLPVELTPWTCLAFYNPVPVCSRKQLRMKWLHRTQATHPGMGLLWTDEGLALSQSRHPGARPPGRPPWHWHPHPASFARSCPADPAWPDPAQLRLARQRSGFQAQAIAMALPDTLLQRFSMQLEPGLHPKQIHAQLAEQLQQRMPAPLAETVWDFHLSVDASTTTATPSSRPAWLLAAMQAQALQTWEVLAAPRAWVTAAQQCCRAAGLTLVRLEPAWQAAKRWQDWERQGHGEACATLSVERTHDARSATALSSDQQAVLSGLALGVVKA